MKFCVDCKYCVISDGTAWCGKDKGRDLVYGTPTMRCVIMREECIVNYDSPCGPKGKFWSRVSE